MRSNKKGHLFYFCNMKFKMYFKYEIKSKLVSALNYEKKILHNLSP